MGSIPPDSNGRLTESEVYTNGDGLHTVHELVTQASERHGHKTAIICGSDSLTYDKLEEYTNNFASALLRRGVRHGNLIAVCLDRSIDMVVAILGIWKAGAAYVPIEPSLPPDRISQMLEDSEPKFIVTHNGEPYDLQLTIKADYVSVQLAHGPQSDQKQGITAANRSQLAYVMYTSGSTGRPKGVEVTHGSIVNLLQAMQGQPGCYKADTLLAITTISFDMAVPELFLPLICGATCVIARKAEIHDMPTLFELLERHRITIIQGTPAIFRMMLDAGWNTQPRLRQIWCGGEALPKALASRLLKLCDNMWNLYGPTEATVYGSMWKVQEDEDVIIGSPIPNGHLYILDEHMRPI